MNTTRLARQRVVSTALGMWLTRDLEGYTDGASLLAYVQNAPLVSVDPFGTTSIGAMLAPLNAQRAKSRECLNAPPLESSTPLCNWYAPCYSYRWANARCFCQCAGDSAWEQAVRGCLACMYFNQVNADTAHDQC